jgi:hypothetical protein
MPRLDKEKAKRNLEVILEKIHTGTDITQLNEYYKLYKKEISLFRRSWTAAWLFMYYDKREIPHAAQSIPVNKKQLGRKPFSEKKEKIPAEIHLSEEESKRLFISIGKNRKFFPREVITLIMSKTSAAREDIGNIRILDNYSFVQVRDTKADEIITKLTGVKFRGRTLTVNYAKPKTEE